MDDLTPSQREALQNLARKKAGDHVGFVNIADARTLTDLGLAQRSREGWDITPEGSALLAGDGDAAPFPT
jgi:glutamine cyclotransferase